MSSEKPSEQHLFRFSEYEIVYEDGVCLLRIESTLIEDEGEYCCTASNVAGSAFSKCYLKLSGEALSAFSYTSIAHFHILGRTRNKKPFLVG